MVRGELTVEAASDLIESLLSSRLELHKTPELYGRALEPANEPCQGAVYDAYYLAPAETLGGHLWTADEKFHRMASPVTDYLYWMGQFVAPG